MAHDPMTAKVHEMPMQTGIERDDRKQLANLLNEALASTYVLYAKTHAVHWNVVGPMFYGVHKLTDEQYNELAQAIDAIAERIRAIGFPALGGLANYQEVSVVADFRELGNTGEMIAQLAADHQAVAMKLREAAEEAEEVKDFYTHDLLTGRIGSHEEAAWMLGSLIAE